MTCMRSRRVREEAQPVHRDRVREAGLLKDILANNAIKLAVEAEAAACCASAALGINYLHSLHPVIVHRDLKPPTCSWTRTGT